MPTAVRPQGSARSFAALLGLLLPAIAALPAIADEPDEWIGQQVVLANESVTLRDGSKTIDNRGRSLYRVQKTSGRWLLLKSETSDLVGWGAREEVVPRRSAFSHFSDEIRRKPSAWAHRHRGMLLLLRRDYDLDVVNTSDDIDLAIDDFEAAIRLDPDDPRSYHLRGLARCALREFDAAIADFDEAIRLEPDEPIFHGARGNARFCKKQYDEAIADHTEAIRLDPGSATTYSDRGMVHAHKREFDGAIADLDEAIRLDPRAMGSYANRGSTWCAMEEYAKALADFDQAIRLDPSSAEVLCNRAGLLATCPDPTIRDGKKAVEAAERACFLSEWKNPACISALAAANAETGDFGLAIKRQDLANAFFSSPEEKRRGEERLALYREGKSYRHDPKEFPPNK